MILNEKALSAVHDKLKTYSSRKLCQKDIIRDIIETYLGALTPLDESTERKV